MFFGTSYQCGDADIYVKDLPCGMFARHLFAPYLHMATAMKEYILVAAEHGNGRIIEIDSENQKYVPNHDEVIVGVYGEVEDFKRGEKYYISLENRFDNYLEKLRLRLKRNK